jgi:transposase
VTTLCDAPRPERPAWPNETFDVVLRSLLILPPEWCGYRVMYWTVRLLCGQLRKNHEQDYSDDIIRRSLHRLRYVWKRPRYMTIDSATEVVTGVPATPGKYDCAIDITITNNGMSWKNAVQLYVTISN